MTDQHDDETERQRREAEAAQNERRAEAIRHEFMRALEASKGWTLTALAMDETDPARLAEMRRTLDQWKSADPCEPLNIEPKNDLEKIVAEAWSRAAMRAAVADCAEYYREGIFFTCEPLEAKELPDLAKTLADKHARYLADLEEYRASGQWIKGEKPIIKERTPEERDAARASVAGMVEDLHDDQQRRKAFRERENQDRQRPEQERQARERAEAERQRKAKEEADRAAFLRAFDQRREAAKDKGQDKNHHRTRDR